VAAFGGDSGHVEFAQVGVQAALLGAGEGGVGAEVVQVAGDIAPGQGQYFVLVGRQVSGHALVVQPVVHGVVGRHEGGLAENRGGQGGQGEDGEQQESG